MPKITVSKIEQLNTLVIRQSNDSKFFIGTNDSIIISVPSLSMIIKFLVQNGYMNKKVLEGILQDVE